MICDKCKKEFESDGQELCAECLTKEEKITSDITDKANENIGNEQPEKKKSHKSLIFIVLLLVIIGAGAYIFLSMSGVLGPKDLGVTYTKEDFNNAIKKAGINITFDGKSGDDLYDYLQQYKTSQEKLAWSDYTIEVTKYEERNFVLTSQEATALISEIAPQFFIFENLQINVLENGEVEGSGTILVNQVIANFAPEQAGNLPSYVPDKLNFYAKGNVIVEENILSLDVKDVKTGAIQTVKPEQIEENVQYFEELYKCVPGLVIHSLKVTSDGKIAVDALIPVDPVIVKK